MAIFGFNNKNNNLEVLNEVKIVSNNELSIYVEGEGRVDHGWINDPYFKVFHGPSKQKAKYVSRIYFSRAEYVKPHGHSTGIPKTLNTKQIRNLVGMIIPDVWDEMNDKMLELTMGSGINRRYNLPNYMELIGKDDR